VTRGQRRLPFVIETITMSNYRFIPEDQKKLVITMLDRGQTPADVELATGISVRTVQRVRRLWLSTGWVIQHPLEAGRPRLLTSLEVSVSNSLHSSLRARLSQFSYSFLRALLNSGQTYISKSCNTHCFLSMTLMCLSTQLIEPYEIVVLQGKR